MRLNTTASATVEIPSLMSGQSRSESRILVGQIYSYPRIPVLNGRTSRIINQDVLHSPIQERTVRIPRHTKDITVTTITRRARIYAATVVLRILRQPLLEVEPVLSQNDNIHQLVPIIHLRIPTPAHNIPNYFSWEISSHL